MSSVITIDVIDDVIARLKALPEFGERVLLVHDEAELVSASKGASLPVAGVVYEGIIPSSEEGAKTTHRVGLSGAELAFSILILYRQDALTKISMLRRSMETLDIVRRSDLRNQRSPTGHYYRFRREFGGEVDKGLVIWMQQWTTVAQLA